MKKVTLRFLTSVVIERGFVDLMDNKHKFGDLQSFENEWLEVEVRPPRVGTQEMLVPRALLVPNTITDREKNVSYFLKDNIDLDYLQGELDNDCNDFIYQKCCQNVYYNFLRSFIQTYPFGNRCYG